MDAKYAVYLVWRHGGMAVWWYGSMVVWWYGCIVEWWYGVPGMEASQ